MNAAVVTARATLNGWPVIKRQIHANGYVTVMVERESIHDPYVVATWYSGLTEGWVWGHYLQTYRDATIDFAETAERNANRGMS